LDEDTDETLVADIVLPEPEEEVLDDDESDKIIPDKDEIIISEAVMQMNMGESREIEKPQDDGLDYHLFATNTMVEVDNKLTNDLPACLVHDCKSVCQPCANIPNNTARQIDKGTQTGNFNNNGTQNMQEEQINKWKLWKTLEGNGILNTNKL